MCVRVNNFFPWRCDSRVRGSRWRVLYVDTYLEIHELQCNAMLAPLKKTLYLPNLSHYHNQYESNLSSLKKYVIDRIGSFLVFIS